MKITIAFTEKEQENADTIVAVLRRLHPGIKVHKSDAHKPFFHMYLTTRKPGNRCNLKEKP